MPNVFDTRQLEQALLHILVTEKMTARMFIHRAREEMFVTGPRKFIFDRARHIFSETGGLLTDALFEFELKQSIEGVDQSSFTAEWMVIKGLDIVEESPESLLDALEKALLAQKVSVICKEAANFLQDGSVEDAVRLLRQESVSLGSKSDDVPVVEITDFIHRKQLIVDKQTNPTKYLGLKTGFSSYDFKTGGLFPAEVTLVSAVTGVGKSTFMKAVAANVVKSGKNVLHITNEESRRQVEMKYDALLSGIPYFSFKNATITPSEMQEWEDSLTELKKTHQYGRLFIKEIPQFDNALAVARAYYELEQLGHNIDLIVIDYMDHMLPVEKSWGENDEQGKVAADVKGLAVSLDRPVMIATQAATAAEAKQEKGRSFGKLDVYGSKRKVHSCNNLIFVIQENHDISQLKPPLGTGTLDSEWECDWFWNIDVAKNRDGAPFFFKARQIVKTGQVLQIGGSAAGSAHGAGTGKPIGAGGKIASPVPGAAEVAAEAAALDSLKKAPDAPVVASEGEGGAVTPSVDNAPPQAPVVSGPPKRSRKVQKSEILSSENLGETV